MTLQGAAALSRAYHVLGLRPGVSPLTVRRRYYALVKQWHPDRHPAAQQAEATRRTQDITESYRILKAAGRHYPPVAGPNPARDRPEAPPAVTHYAIETWFDRVAAAAVGLGLGIGLDLWWFVGFSSPLWVAIPLLCAAAGALWGWRPIRWLLWWAV